MNAPLVTAKRGVVLVNIGTPEAPTVPAVRRYLAEFLGDPRVLDMPAAARWLLLNLIILPFRPKRSAHAYQQIWTKEGSPLLVHAKAQVEALQRALPGVKVVLAMRYGAPSLGEALETLATEGVTEVTLVPMFPQYAAASTGSAVAEWHRLLGQQVQPPASSVLPAFFSLPGFIEACAERVRETVARVNADHVLFSYHGLPVKQVRPHCEAKCATTAGPCPPLSASNAHCYRAQCFATSAALVKATGVTSSSTAFQSRLKGERWLSPFTDEVLVELAQKGVKRLAVVCPSFVADCLETLEEIGLRAAADFKAAGGESLTLVPAVNDSPRFIEALAQALDRRSP